MKLAAVRPRMGSKRVMIDSRAIPNGLTHVKDLECSTSTEERWVEPGLQGGGTAVPQLGSCLLFLCTRIAQSQPKCCSHGRPPAQWPYGTFQDHPNIRSKCPQRREPFRRVKPSSGKPSR